MASAPTRSLIVWEWEDELFCWRPYEPHISNFIEQNQTTRASLNLGPADIKFKQYDIDFSRGVQIRNNTGNYFIAIASLYYGLTLKFRAYTKDLGCRSVRPSVAFDVSCTSWNC